MKPLLSRTLRPLFSRRAFTLAEFLVVVAVVTLLSSYLVIYSGTSRTQTALYIEEAKLAQVVLRAKALAISTYGAPAVPCGYGLHMDYPAEKYSLFSYSAANCSTISSIDPTNSGYQALQTFALGRGLAFQSCPVGAPEPNKLDNVLFLPPDPRTLVWAGGSPLPIAGGSGKVYLATEDCSLGIAVTVSTAGQVSF